MSNSDTPNAMSKSRMYLTYGLRCRGTRRTAVAIREMRTALLSPGLCLLLIALLLQPLRAEATTAGQAKELYKLYAHTQLLNDKQYQCLDRLWNRESRWDPTARNSKSTAYGIPQLIDLKETNGFKQIDMGIKYIVHRYGTPCNAYIHHKKVGNY